jgi:hypothetical protein
MMDGSERLGTSSVEMSGTDKHLSDVSVCVLRKRMLGTSCKDCGFGYKQYLWG